MTLVTRAGKGSPITATEHDNNWKHGLAVSAEAFGVVPDGSTDNATALREMRDWCETHAADGVTIVLPRGTIRYSDNKWLPHCRRVEVVGYGAKVQNTQAGGSSYDWYPFFQGDIFTDRPDGIEGNLAPYRGSGHGLIETVSGGSSVVTLVDPAKASLFTAGDLALVCGYDQQGWGYPPNLRYCEWHSVEKVGGSSIALRTPLSHVYRSDWRLNSEAGGFGPGAIISLDRTRFKYCRSLTIRGLHILPNLNKPYPGFLNGLILVGQHVYLEDVEHQGSFWPQQSQLVHARNCYFRDCSDIDKVAGTVCFDGCTIDRDTVNNWSLGAATGVRHLVVQNCTLNGRVRVGPRQLTFERNVVNNSMTGDGGSLQYYPLGPTESMTIRGNKFHLPAGQFHVVGNETESFDVKAGSSGSFTVDKGTHQPARRLDVGSHVWTANWAKRARIISSGWNGTDYVFTHDARATFDTGETVYYSGCRTVIHENNEVFRAGVRVEQDHTFVRNSGPQFERRRDWRYRGRPRPTERDRRILHTTYTGYATRLIYRVLRASSVAPRHRLVLIDGTGEPVTAYAGDTEQDGAFLVVDLLAGSTDFHGVWTNRQGLPAPLAQPIINIHTHRIETTSASDPSYAEDGSDTPLFDLLVEGASAIL